jgi:hypothetical protein
VTQRAPRVSPTVHAGARTAARGAIRGPRRARDGSRVKLPEPRIFIALKRGPAGEQYAQAHLRNKRGYVYLTWRDGDRVRTFYLGKAPRNALHASLPGPQLGRQARGAGATSTSCSRRAKRKAS